MAEQVNEWKDEMHYMYDDKGNDSNVYKYILQSKCHSINDFKEQMNEKNLRNAFNRFNWLQSHRFWRKRNVCVCLSVCIIKTNGKKTKKRKHFRCIEYESGVNWNCINKPFRMKMKEIKKKKKIQQHQQQMNERINEWKKKRTAHKNNKQHQSLWVFLWLMHFNWYEYIIISGTLVACTSCW